MEWGGVYYRPLIMVSYLVEDKLNDAWVVDYRKTLKGREDPRRATIPHATTLLIHVLTAAGAALFARRCLRGRAGAEWGALAAGLVFALHPVHAESVGTIAGRSDSMAVLFLLPALLFALDGREKRSLWKLAAAGFLYLLALLSKEVALAGLALLPLCLWMLPEAPETDRKPFPRWAPLAAFLAGAAAYAALRLGIDSNMGGSSSMGVAELVGTLFRVAAFYGSEIFAPWPMSPYIPDLPGGILTAAVAAVWLFFLLLAVVLYRRGAKIYLFCLLWFALAVAPSLAVAVRVIAETVVAERYLYLPSVGFAVAIGSVAASVSATRFRKAAAGALAALLAVYAVTSWQGTAMFQTDLTLWTALTRQKATSRHALPWVNLATNQLIAGDMKASEISFKRALVVEAGTDMEDRALALNGLGAIRFNEGMKAYKDGRRAEAMRLIDESERYHEQSVGTGLPDWTLVKNLANVRLQKVYLGKSINGRFDRVLLEKARRDIEYGLRISPGNPDLMRLMDTYRGYVSHASKEP